MDMIRVTCRDLLLGLLYRLAELSHEEVEWFSWPGGWRWWLKGVGTLLSALAATTLFYIGCPELATGDWSQAITLYYYYRLVYQQPETTQGLQPNTSQRPQKYDCLFVTSELLLLLSPAKDYSTFSRWQGRTIGWVGGNDYDYYEWPDYVYLLIPHILPIY